MVSFFKRDWVFLLTILPWIMGAQSFTRHDSLRGSITPERQWWDLQHYTLDVALSIEQKSIFGSNTIRYRVNAEQPQGRNSALIFQDGLRMQIDLQAPMNIDSIKQDGQLLSFSKDGAAHFVKLIKPHKVNQEDSLICYFSGTPIEAKNPPWDGGFTWETDELGRAFIANANQGIGASVWWPNKDHPSDEPDRGIDLKITLPKPLVAVGNGRLVGITDLSQDLHRYHWRVISPINNYGVNINVGHYNKFSEQYPGLGGNLDCSYWVLDYNLEQAKAQFAQVSMMLEAFEYWFGPYPFYEDGYQLVEVPYLGMEHQSSVTYGNGYRNGYRGTDLSGSGWGMTFDFIIIHESGHEWFANNITNKDVADMWIHEGFTAYSENLFLNYFHGTEASSAYVLGTKKRIMNDPPIVRPYGVNKEGSSDMYYKGANILHTLRQLIENDQQWRQILIGLNSEFRHKTVTTDQIEHYISKATGIDLTEFWEQYLRRANIPVFDYLIDQNTLKYRYLDVVDGFDMPLKVNINDETLWLYPNKTWQSLTAAQPLKTFAIDPNFLVTTRIETQD